jgi:hypothetical protein
MKSNESPPAEGDRSGGTVGGREAAAYLLLAHRFAVLRDSVTDTLDQAARAAETGEFTEYHVGKLRSTSRRSPRSARSSLQRRSRLRRSQR